MQNNTQRERRAPVSADPSARRRSVQTGTTRRPSGFSAPNAKRPSAPSAQPTRPAQKRFAQKRNKRSRNQRLSGRWKVVLSAAGAALLVALLAVLISTAVRGTYHQLPKVTRIEDYTPEPVTAAPDSSPEAPEPFNDAFAADLSVPNAAFTRGAEAA